MKSRQGGFNRALPFTHLLTVSFAVIALYFLFAMHKKQKQQGEQRL
jgi:Na+/H+ antiporter NhaB